MGFKNDNMLVQEYVYDFDVDGGAIGAIDLSAKASKEPLPVGAVAKRYTRKVLTAFTSGGSATVAVGNGDSATKYESAVAVASLTANALAEDNAALNAILDAADGQLIVTIATADLTAGKAVYMVEFHMPQG